MDRHQQGGIGPDFFKKNWSVALLGISTANRYFSVPKIKNFIMIGRGVCVGASSEPRTGPSAAHGSPFLWSVSAPGHRKSPFMVLRDRAKVQGAWGGRGVRGKAHGA